MWGWVGQRLLAAFLAISVTFFALRLIPGDPVTAALLESGMDAATIEARQAELGLNIPIFAQFFAYWGGVLRGDLGVSLSRGLPVMAMIAEAFPHTLSLALGALCVAASIGLALGTAHLNSGVVGRVARVVIGLSLSAPLYWTGTIALMVFSVWLQMLPSSGVGTWRHLILPVFVLGFHTSGAVARITQSSLREVSGQDFIRTAQSKGLSERYIFTQHVLRAALPPIVNVILLQAGFLLGGVVITEYLFVRPGIGRLLLDGVLRRDYTLVQGIVAVNVLIYLVLNTSADVLLRLLDPRVRL